MDRGKGYKTAWFFLATARRSTPLEDKVLHGMLWETGWQTEGNRVLKCLLQGHVDVAKCSAGE